MSCRGVKYLPERTLRQRSDGTYFRELPVAPFHRRTMGEIPARSVQLWWWSGLYTVKIMDYKNSRGIQQAGPLVFDVPQPDDLDEIFAIATDPRTWVHIPGERVTDPAQVRASLAMFGRGWQEHGLSHWVLRLGNSGTYPGLVPGQVLGTGGVHLFEMGAGPSVWNLGYRLEPGGWGHGFATRLARHALTKAGETRAEVPVIARVLSTNPASARVAAKVGLRLLWTGEASQKTRASVGLDSVQRLIFADRTLEPEVLEWLISRG